MDGAEPAALHARILRAPLRSFCSRFRASIQRSTLNLGVAAVAISLVHAGCASPSRWQSSQGATFRSQSAPTQSVATTAVVDERQAADNSATLVAHSDATNEVRDIPAGMKQATAGLPILAGNRLQLMSSFDGTLQSLIEDIDAAERTCHFEFYIWSDGGRADDVAAALLRAEARGVECRVLLDTIGSREFLLSETAKRMRKGGVEVQAALPARIARWPMMRIDSRIHRKIVVIDGEIGYVGSLNIADPRYFNRSEGVGRWIDAMTRIEGPAVRSLDEIFDADWERDSSKHMDISPAANNPAELAGGIPVQVIPSGPLDDVAEIEPVVLAAINSARERVTLTTPYFVPVESLVTALTSAAKRGVDVTLIVPAKLDSQLVSLSGQAAYGGLIAAGVRVLQFEKGLLHTKSVTVDGEFSLFGSLNLDPRSLYLNFEVTLAVYDPTFTANLEALQARYAKNSRPVKMSEWQQRGWAAPLLESSASLFNPLL